MGNSSAIIVISIDQGPISITSHWGGPANLTAVENVLSRKNTHNHAPTLIARLYAEFAKLSASVDGESMQIISGGVGMLWTDNPNVTVIAETSEYFVGDHPAITFKNKKARPPSKSAHEEVAENER